jgi:cytochrome bd-type quinol oxidase subunit 2
MKRILITISLLASVSLLSAMPVMAQVNTSQGTPSPNGTLNRLSNILKNKPSYNTDVSPDSLMQYLGIILNVFLGLLGTIFIFLMVYGGYTWMTASGDEKKVEKAQDTIRVAIIGLLVIAGSYAIWQFLFYGLLNR